MKLYVQHFLEASIAGVDLRTALSRSELNRLQASGKTRQKIREQVFLRMVRASVANANFDHVDGAWTAAATEKGKADYLRRLAPFLLPELAHTAAAFVIDRDVMPEALKEQDALQPCEVDRISEAHAAIETIDNIYLEFPPDTVISRETGSLHMIVMTKTSSGWKCSATLELDPESLESAVVSWYITDHLAGPFTNVIFSAEPPNGLDWNALCQKLTSLLHHCMARGSLAGATTQHQSPQPETAKKGTALLRAEVNYPGCLFRVTHLRNKADQRGAHLKGGGNKLTKHIIVPGFFTTVRYGKGRELKRRQWISDYHKGPRHQPIETKVRLTKVANLQRRKGVDGNVLVHHPVCMPPVLTGARSGSSGALP